MACCAVVVFILSQIYVAFTSLRELIFGNSEEPGFQASGAAAWRLGDPPARTPRGVSQSSMR